MYSAFPLPDDGEVKPVKIELLDHDYCIPSSFDEGQGGNGNQIAIGQDPSMPVAVKKEKEGEEQNKENEENKENKEKKEGEGDETEIDITLSNVVGHFSLGCELNLRYIALNGLNVEYRKKSEMLVMKLRKPRVTTTMWASGKATITGVGSIEDTRKGARRCARIIQKMGFNVNFCNYRVVNVLATSTFPFAIKVYDFARANPKTACYEPELHSGVSFKIKELGVSAKIFTTGSLTVTARTIEKIDIAVQTIYGLVYAFKMPKLPEHIKEPIPEPIPIRKQKALKRKALKELGGNELQTPGTSKPKKSNAKPKAPKAPKTPKTPKAPKTPKPPKVPKTPKPPKNPNAKPRKSKAKAAADNAPIKTEMEESKMSAGSTAATAYYDCENRENW